MQHSINGITFTTIANDTPIANSLSIHQYQFQNKNIATGNNFYSLKMIDNTATKTEYSQIINLAVSASNSLVISPNPTSDYLNVQSSLFAIGRINYKVIDANGKVVISENCLTTNSLQINESELMGGNYLLVLEEGKGYSEMQKFVKQ